MRTYTATLLTLLGLAACSDDLNPASTVDKPRVIGAQVSVTSDPERAWPVVGENTTVRWVLAYPEAPVPLSWSMVACVRAAVDVGVDFCRMMPFASATAPMPTLDQPTIAFDIPSASFELNDNQILVRAVFCEQGVPFVDERQTDAYCDVGGQKQRALSQASVTLTVQTAMQTNRNPHADDNATRFAGQTWLPLSGPPPASDCAALAPSEELPHYALRSGRAALALDIDETDRERYLTTEGNEVRESLLISHLTNLGSMERTYTIVEANDERTGLGVIIDWNMPDVSSVNPAGSLVTFYFALRDNRGGFDWITRAACLTP